MNLVTGATGHIGNVLVRTLLESGKKVRALVLPGEDRLPLKDLPVECCEGNVLDPTSLAPAFDGVEYVYHLAGAISIMPGKDVAVSRVNVEGTCNVLEAARRARVRRMVYTSSIHAIRRVPHGLVVDEDLPFDPQHAISEYDRSKAEATLLALQACQKGLDVVVACPTGVIGPYDFRLSEMGSVIYDWSRQSIQLGIVPGAYDFVDVRDVAQGEILACEKGRTGESYILSGELITVPRMMELIHDMTHLPSLRIHVPFRLARVLAIIAPLYYRLTGQKPRFTPYALETLASNANISHQKAERELGYSPRPLRQSIQDTINWFLSRRAQLRA